ncbi:MAG: glycosyltransferase family 1 protein, partial [Bacteroidota bacterium]
MANSSNQQLHIVSLNVPYPADYGGVIDIFYKVRALHDLGVQIHLHCYDYGRGPQAKLEELCASVHYYPRATGWRSQLSTLPYIIRSRSSKALLNRLQADKFPILLEGLHTAYWFIKGALAPERIFLRSHNVEHDYYRALAQQSKGWRRWYFQKEAWQLEQVLSQLPPVTRIAAISPPDTAYYQKRWPNTFWLPPFHPNTEVDIKLG